MRPSALPKLVVAQQSDDMTSDRYGDHADSPNSIISAHSRNSSTASDYSPLTHTFSFQDHNRFSDSASSLGTTPPKQETCTHKDSFESPRASKTTLGDLVEVPDEREDGFDHLTLTQSRCPCPPPFCIRQCYSASALERPSLDYSLADGFNSDHEAPLRSSKVRRGSGNAPAAGFANRIGSRLPSLSRRVRENPPPASPSRQQSVRSAPTSRVPSRASSFRLPSLNKSFIGYHENIDLAVATPPGTPIRTALEEEPQTELPPLEMHMALTEEPIDRKALASTPLLPTPLLERCGSDYEEIQSPLQSPTVADSPVFSYAMSPATTPVLTAVASPELSPKHSFASFGGPRSSQVLSSPDSSFVEPLDVEDKWAARLGHANFIVYPAPYTPDVCDSASCKRLVEDWEEARKQFINQAARTREHYGPTSQAYKLTEQKWTEVDALWRRNHEMAVEQAKKVEKSRGEAPHEARLPERDYQPLAEPAPLAKLPSLNDPDNTGKFLKLDEADIVGPMVQYAQITTQASKRTAFLRFFRDLRFPANTLGNTASAYRR